MRSERLQQVVVRSCAISGAVVVGALVLMGAIYHVKSLQEDELNRLNSNIRRTNTAIQQLEEKYNKAKGSVKIYEAFRQRQEGSNAILDRKKLADFLGALKDQYHLTRLELSISAISNPTYSELTSPELVVEHTLVKLRFSALTDELALSFIDNMSRAAPGYVHVETLRMQRTGEMNDQFFQRLVSDKPVPLVDVDMQFHWIGFGPKKQAEGAAP
jgi:outer membrane murein-binding lipoprotein Lpp